MSAFSASKIFRPPSAARVARGSGTAERTQEQVLADWLEDMGQLSRAERVKEALAHLDASCPDEGTGYLVRRDGLLVYEGPVGEIPEDPVALARQERLDDLLR